MVSGTHVPARIFLADEEYVLASMLADLLRRKGLGCSGLGDPDEALEAAHSAPPDLLVCDVEIPPRSSLEFAKRMRRQSPDCKVLLFSTHSGANSLLESVRSAAKDFILLFGPSISTSCSNRFISPWITHTFKSWMSRQDWPTMPQKDLTAAADAIAVPATHTQ